jgi:PAS domain S-box-containing protein
VVVFILTLVEWRQRKGRSAAWAAATLGAMAAIVAVGVVVGDQETSLWLVKPLLAVLVVFPYLLFRFMGTFVRPSRRMEALAGTLTGLVVGWTLLMPRFPRPGQPWAGWFAGYIFALLIQWLFLSAIVAVRLWRAGRGQPAVARRRMRLLSLASVGLSVAFVIAGSAGSGGSGGQTPHGFAELVVQLVAFGTGLCFYLGLVPPSLLRMAWRRPEEAALRAAARDLMRASTVGEVTAALLPRLAPAFGGNAALIADSAGRPVAAYGMDEAEALRLAKSVEESHRKEVDTGRLVFPLTSGWIAVRASPFTPFFGRDEIDLLKDLGALADLALQRADLFDREREAREAALRAQEAQARLAAIVQASHDAILAKTPDGVVTDWNPGAERLFGYTAEEMVGRNIVDLIPPEGRQAEAELLQRAAQGLAIEQYESSRIRKDGTTVPVSITLSPIPDASGTIGGIASVCRDVTERKQFETALRDREEALAAARDQALEASRLKSQFLANMSHEIRTPMNGVLGMAQLLLNSDLDVTQRRQLLALRDSGRTLLTVINDILDFSKVEAGKLELEETDVDLFGSLESVISMLSSPAHDKGLALHLDVSPDVPPFVRGDPVRLRQVLINLLGNAVKFTEAGSVTLRVANRVGICRRFEVEDTGIGIPESARGRLLDPFSQADASTTRRFGGTGLGLAICRQLVELMGGTLDFGSVLGEGSTFWFEVPLPAVDVQRPPAGEATPQTLHPAADSGVKPGARLLLAEDADINQEVAVALLGGLGYSIDVVSNGVEALEAVQREHYDAVLMDCLMPVMDGYEATGHIRRLDAAVRHIPIIALTASAMSGDRERCLAAGMDDYVSKPLELDVLAAALARVRPGRAPKPAPGADPAVPTAPAPAAAPEDVVVRLRDLQSRISPEAFTRVCAAFFSQAPSLVDALRGAVRAGDLELTRSLAHKLKGSMASVGAIRLSRIAAEMEQAEGGRDAARRLAELTDRLDEEYARVRVLVAEVAPQAARTS